MVDVAPHRPTVPVPPGCPEDCRAWLQAAAARTSASRQEACDALDHLDGRRPLSDRARAWLERLAQTSTRQGGHARQLLRGAAVLELCDAPTPATPRLPAGPWTLELLAEAYVTAWPGGAYESRHLRCEACHSDSERYLYQDEWGEWCCGECVTLCGHCGERRAVVSARRPAGPREEFPGHIDHVCLGCLEEHWETGETARPLSSALSAAGGAQ